MPDTPRLIKKYPNRRLYDTRKSAYITLADIRQLIDAGEAIRVVGARSNEDLTRSVLLQVIGEDAACQAVFSTQFLAGAIRSRARGDTAALAAHLDAVLENVKPITPTMESSE